MTLSYLAHYIFELACVIIGYDTFIHQWPALLESSLLRLPQSSLITNMAGPNGPERSVEAARHSSSFSAWKKGCCTQSEGHVWRETWRQSLL